MCVNVLFRVTMDRYHDLFMVVVFRRSLVRKLTIDGNELRRLALR